MAFHLQRGGRHKPMLYRKNVVGPGTHSVVQARGSGRVIQAIRLVVFAGVVLLSHLAAVGSQRVSLAWEPTPGLVAGGYYIYYGTRPGIYTNRVDAGSANAASVPGLRSGTTYYFAVRAYTFGGLESPFSNEIAYTVPFPNIRMSMNFVGQSRSPKTLSIKGTGVLPESWVLEASDDLMRWWPVHRGTNAVADVPAIVSDRRQMFFRLKTPTRNVKLKMERGLAGSPKDTFCLTSSAAFLPSWTVEGSADLKNWSPMISGTNCAVNVPVIATERKAMFFRLRGTQ